MPHLFTQIADTEFFKRSGNLVDGDTPSGGGFDGTGIANHVAFYSDADTLDANGNLTFNPGTTTFTAAALVSDASGIYFSSVANGASLKDGVFKLKTVSGGGAVYMDIRTDNGTAPVSFANAGSIRYNSGTQRFEKSENTGAWVDLSSGTSLSGSVEAGHVAYASALDVLTSSADADANQLKAFVVNGNPANKNVLAIGSLAGLTLGLGQLHFENVTGISAVYMHGTDSGAAFFECRNAAETDILFTVSDQGEVVAANLDLDVDLPNGAVTFASRIRATGVTLFNVAPTGTVTVGTWQGSAIGVAFGGTGSTTTFTTGSVVFAGASGVYSQDNAGLFYDPTNNNLGLNVNTFGTNAAGVFALGTGATEVSAAVADTVQLYSVDLTAGNTTLGIFTEGTWALLTGQADSASATRVKIRVNGTTVELLAV